MAWAKSQIIGARAGRKEEARAALETAVREEIDPNGVRRQAERALKEVQ